MQKSYPKRKARIAAGVVGLLIVVGYLRETGRVGLNLYQSESSATSMTSESSQSSGNDPPMISASAMGQPATRIVTASGDQALVRELRGAIAGVSGSRTPLQIVIRNLHTSGPYFFPLYKTGDCAYDIVISDGNPEAVEPEGVDKNIHYRASPKGEVHQTVKGVCSAYHFQELVGQGVAQHVRQMLVKYESEPPPKA